MARRSEYRPPLPNVGSAGQTPASLAIDVHYANLMLVERWDWPRFLKLANLLKLTPHELASLVLLPHKYVDDYRLRNGLPMTYNWARPVAMLLTLVELHVAGHLTADVVQEPFPKL